MHQAIHEEHVTTEVCRERHAMTKWVLGVLVTLSSVFLAGAVYAVSIAGDASEEARTTTTTLKAHVAAQQEMERHLKQRLDEIRADVHDNRVLLQEILRNGRSSH